MKSSRGEVVQHKKPNVTSAGGRSQHAGLWHGPKRPWWVWTDRDRTHLADDLVPAVVEHHVNDRPDHLQVGDLGLTDAEVTDLYPDPGLNPGLI